MNPFRIPTDFRPRCRSPEQVLVGWRRTEEVMTMAGEAENVRMVEVVAVMEPEVVVDAGGRSKG